MLKRIVVVIVGVVLLQQSAYVPPTYAASASVMIVAVQSGVTGGATEEYIAIYNSSSAEVDITGWCFRNKNDVDISCFGNGEAHLRTMLPGYSYTLVISESFQQVHDYIVPAKVFQPISQSSGSLVGSSDTVVLVDTVGNEIDRMGWTTTAPSGFIYERQRNLNLETEDGLPFIYTDTDNSEDWLVGPMVSVPIDQTYVRELEVVLPPAPTVTITELFPNPAGVDADAEFIELYNDGEEAADIGGLQLWLGISPTQPIVLPAGLAILPGERFLLTHDIVGYSLVNTIGKVALATSNGQIFYETDVYENPKDDRSWSLIDGFWQYTDQPTPGGSNLPNRTVAPKTSVPQPSLKPCAANQYRHPETNRCRLLQTATSAPAPCRADQYRSPETNRCRKIVEESALTPCKEGQERNEETNRCRTIKAMSAADYSVLGVQNEPQPDQWYIIAAIGVGVLGLAAYGGWEWRHEIQHGAQRLWKFVSRRK